MTAEQLRDSSQGASRRNYSTRSLLGDFDFRCHMNRDKALASCTRYFDDGRLLGYFPLPAANFLVGTGEFEFFRADCWGYILRKVTHG